MAAPGFFCWGAKRGLNSSEGVLKKRIQLRESNERLTLAISFFIYSSFEKDIFYFFVVLNFSFATVITQTKIINATIFCPIFQELNSKI